jgi:hypothetical protein
MNIGAKRGDFQITFSLEFVFDVEGFVGREGELEEIRHSLVGEGKRKTVVLHGLGGIGKTQLSIAYAKRYKDLYSAVFWLDVRDEDTLKESFGRVAKQILREHPTVSCLSGIDEKDADEVVEGVKTWLGLPHNTMWLLILNNYDNPKSHGNTDPAALDIKKFLPKSYQGSIIITTRSSQIRIGHSIHIRKFSNVDDSLAILSSASRRQGLQNGTKSPWFTLLL